MDSISVWLRSDFFLSKGSAILAAKSHGWLQSYCLFVKAGTFFFEHMGKNILGFLQELVSRKKSEAWTVGKILTVYNIYIYMFL